MAEKKPLMTVSVFEGHYVNLNRAGVPISLCLHLKELGLCFGDAVWTAKQSLSGFSISFFWDKRHAASKEVASLESKKKKRKRRRRKLARQEEGPLRIKACKLLVPIDAHHHMASIRDDESADLRSNLRLRQLHMRIQEMTFTSWNVSRYKCGG